MKTIISVLSCYNEFASDVPEFVVAQIEKETADRIVRIHRSISNDLTVYSVVLHLFNGKFYSDTDTLLDFDETDYPDTNEKFDELLSLADEKETSAMEFQQIHILSSGFIQLSALPKHGSAHFTVESRLIPINDFINESRILML